MPLLTPNVPKGLIDLMKSLTKEVLRDKPENIYEYAAVHFEKQLSERDGSLDKDYELFNAYKDCLEGQQQFVIPSSLGFKCQKTPKPSGPRRSKPDIMSSFRVMESIHEEDALAENLYNEEKYLKAIYVIQRYYRRYVAKKNTSTNSDRQRLSEATAAIIIQRTMRKLFANKFASIPGGETVSLSEALVPQEDVDNISEAASYTSSSTIQMLAEGQEGRENRLTTGREEIADDNDVAKGDGSTTGTHEPPALQNSTTEMEVQPGKQEVDGKSMAHENDESGLISQKNVSTNLSATKVSDDTSTAPIGILSTKIGSNDQLNFPQTNTVVVAKGSNISESTQIRPPYDVDSIERDLLQSPQSHESVVDTPPSRQGTEKTFSGRLQSNAFVDNNAGYSIQGIASNRKLNPNTGESLKMYNVFYQDGDDPDFSDSLNESTMERDSLETEDLDVDSLESNDNSTHVGAIAKRETIQVTVDNHCDGDSEEEKKCEEQQNALEAELERVPSYIYGIHPKRTPVLERKLIKNKATHEVENIQVGLEDKSPDEKSEEESMESKESTSGESSATQIENILEAQDDQNNEYMEDDEMKSVGDTLNTNHKELADEIANNEFATEPQTTVELGNDCDQKAHNFIEGVSEAIQNSEDCSQTALTESGHNKVEMKAKEMGIGENKSEVNEEMRKFSKLENSLQTSSIESHKNDGNQIENDNSPSTSANSGNAEPGYFESLYHISNTPQPPSEHQASEVESQLKDLRNLCNLYPGLEIKDVISEFHTKHIQPEESRKNSVYDDNNNVEDFEMKSSVNSEEESEVFEDSNGADAGEDSKIWGPVDESKLSPLIANDDLHKSLDHKESEHMTKVIGDKEANNLEVKKLGKIPNSKIQKKESGESENSKESEQNVGPVLEVGERGGNMMDDGPSREAVCELGTSENSKLEDLKVKHDQTESVNPEIPQAPEAEEEMNVKKLNIDATKPERKNKQPEPLYEIRAEAEINYNQVEDQLEDQSKDQDKAKRTLSTTSEAGIPEIDENCDQSTSSVNFNEVSKSKADFSEETKEDTELYSKSSEDPCELSKACDGENKENTEEKSGVEVESKPDLAKVSENLSEAKDNHANIQTITIHEIDVTVDPREDQIIKQEESQESIVKIVDTFGQSISLHEEENIDEIVVANYQHQENDEKETTEKFKESNEFNFGKNNKETKMKKEDDEIKSPEQLNALDGIEKESTDSFGGSEHINETSSGSKEILNEEFIDKVTKNEIASEQQLQSGILKLITPDIIEGGHVEEPHILQILIDDNKKRDEKKSVEVEGEIIEKTLSDKSEINERSTNSRGNTEVNKDQVIDLQQETIAEIAVIEPPMESVKVTNSSSDKSSLKLKPTNATLGAYGGDAEIIPDEQDLRPKAMEPISEENKTESTDRFQGKVEVLNSDTQDVKAEQKEPISEEVSTDSTEDKAMLDELKETVLEGKVEVLNSDTQDAKAEQKQPASEEVANDSTEDKAMLDELKETVLEDKVEVINFDTQDIKVEQKELTSEEVATDSAEEKVKLDELKETVIEDKVEVFNSDTLDTNLGQREPTSEEVATDSTEDKAKLDELKETVIEDKVEVFNSNTLDTKVGQREPTSEEVATDSTEEKVKLDELKETVIEDKVEVFNSDTLDTNLGQREPTSEEVATDSTEDKAKLDELKETILEDKVEVLNSDTQDVKAEQREPISEEVATDSTEEKAKLDELKETVLEVATDSTEDKAKFDELKETVLEGKVEVLNSDTQDAKTEQKEPISEEVTTDSTEDKAKLDELKETVLEGKVEVLKSDTQDVNAEQGEPISEEVALDSTEDKAKLDELKERVLEGKDEVLNSDTQDVKAEQKEPISEEVATDFREDKAKLDELKETVLEGKDEVLNSDTQDVKAEQREPISEEVATDSTADKAKLDELKETVLEGKVEVLNSDIQDIKVERKELTSEEVATDSTEETVKLDELKETVIEDKVEVFNSDTQDVKAEQKEPISEEVALDSTEDKAKLDELKETVLEGKVEVLNSDTQDVKAEQKEPISEEVATNCTKDKTKLDTSDQLKDKELKCLENVTKSGLTEVLRSFKCDSHHSSDEEQRQTQKDLEKLDQDEVQEIIGETGLIDVLKGYENETLSCDNKQKEAVQILSQVVDLDLDKTGLTDALRSFKSDNLDGRNQTQEDVEQAATQPNEETSTQNEAVEGIDDTGLSNLLRSLKEVTFSDSREQEETEKPTALDKAEESIKEIGLKDISNYVSHSGGIDHDAMQKGRETISDSSITENSKSIDGTKADIHVEDINVSECNEEKSASGHIRNTESNNENVQRTVKASPLEIEYEDRNLNQPSEFAEAQKIDEFAKLSNNDDDKKEKETILNSSNGDVQVKENIETVDKNNESVMPEIKRNKRSLSNDDSEQQSLKHISTTASKCDTLVEESDQVLENDRKDPAAVTIVIHHSDDSASDEKDQELISKEIPNHTYDLHDPDFSLKDLGSKTSVDADNEVDSKKETDRVQPTDSQTAATEKLDNAYATERRDAALPSDDTILIVNNKTESSSENIEDSVDIDKEANSCGNATEEINLKESVATDRKDILQQGVKEDKAPLKCPENVSEEGNEFMKSTIENSIIDGLENQGEIVVGEGEVLEEGIASVAENTTQGDKVNENSITDDLRINELKEGEIEKEKQFDVQSEGAGPDLILKHRENCKENLKTLTDALETSSLEDKNVSKRPVVNKITDLAEGREEISSNDDTYQEQDEDDNETEIIMVDREIGATENVSEKTASNGNINSTTVEVTLIRPDDFRIEDNPKSCLEKHDSMGNEDIFDNLNAVSNYDTIVDLDVHKIISNKNDSDLIEVNIKCTQENTNLDGSVKIDQEKEEDVVIQKRETQTENKNTNPQPINSELKTGIPGASSLATDVTHIVNDNKPASPAPAQENPANDQDELTNQKDPTLCSPSGSTEITGIDDNTANTSADFSSIGKDLDFFEDTIHYLKSATAQLSAIGATLEQTKGNEKFNLKNTSKTEENFNRAAIIIQSAIRGYRARRAFKKNLSASRKKLTVLKTAENSIVASSIPVAIIHPTKHSEENQKTEVDASQLEMLNEQGTNGANVGSTQETVNSRSEIPRLRREKPLERKAKIYDSATSQSEAKVQTAKVKSVEKAPQIKPRLTREKPIERPTKSVKAESFDETKRKGNAMREVPSSSRNEPSSKDRPNPRTASSNLPERHRLTKSKRDQFAKKGKSLSTTAQAQKPLVFDLEAIKKDLLTKKSVSQSGKKTRAVPRRDTVKEKDGSKEEWANVDQSKGSGKKNQLDSATRPKASQNENQTRAVDRKMSFQETTSADNKKTHVPLSVELASESIKEGKDFKNKTDINIDKVISKDTLNELSIDIECGGQSSKSLNAEKISEGETNKQSLAIESQNLKEKASNNESIKPFTGITHEIDKDNLAAVGKPNVLTSTSTENTVFDTKDTDKSETDPEQLVVELGERTEQESTKDSAESVTVDIESFSQIKAAATEVLKLEIGELENTILNLSNEVEESTIKEKIDEIIIEDTRIKTLQESNDQSKNKGSILLAGGSDQEHEKPENYPQFSSKDNEANGLKQEVLDTTAIKGEIVITQKCTETKTKDSKDEDTSLMKQNDPGSLELEIKKNHVDNGESEVKMDTPKGNENENCNTDVTTETEICERTYEEDLNKPAILIQKTFRGYNVRKTLNNKIPTFNDDPECFKTPESNDIFKMDNITDPILDTSATVIQKNFRGYRTRRDLKHASKPQQSAPSSDSDQSQNLNDDFETRKNRKAIRSDTVIERVAQLTEKPIPELNTDLQQAAMMIQKSYRGYKTRKGLQKTEENQSIDAGDKEEILESTVNEKPTRHASNNHKSTSANALLESAAVTIQKAYRAYHDRKVSSFSEGPVKSFSHGAHREFTSKETVENSDESSTFIGPDTSFDLSDVESVETKSEQVSDPSTFVLTDETTSKTPTLIITLPADDLQTPLIESEIRRKRNIMEPSAPALEEILQFDEDDSSSDRKPQWYVGDDLIIPTDATNLSIEPSTSQYNPLASSSSSRFENSCRTDAQIEISNKQSTPSIQSAVVSTSSLLFPNDAEMHNLDPFTKPSRPVSAEDSREGEENEKEIQENAEKQELEEQTAGSLQKGENECKGVLKADPFSVVIKIEDLSELPGDDVLEVEADVCRSCADGLHEAGLGTASPRRKSIEEISREIDEMATIAEQTKDDNADDSGNENLDKIEQFVLMDEVSESACDKCKNINCNKSHNDLDLPDLDETNKIDIKDDKNDNANDNQMSEIQSEDDKQRPEELLQNTIDNGDSDQKKSPGIIANPPSSDDDLLHVGAIDEKTEDDVDSQETMTKKEPGENSDQIREVAQLDTEDPGTSDNSKRDTKESNHNTGLNSVNKNLKSDTLTAVNDIMCEVNSTQNDLNNEAGEVLSDLKTENNCEAEMNDDSHGQNSIPTKVEGTDNETTRDKILEKISEEDAITPFQQTPQSAAPKAGSESDANDENIHSTEYSLKGKDAPASQQDHAEISSNCVSEAEKRPIYVSNERNNSDMNCGEDQESLKIKHSEDIVVNDAIADQFTENQSTETDISPPLTQKVSTEVLSEMLDAGEKSQNSTAEPDKHPLETKHTTSKTVEVALASGENAEPKSTKVDDKLSQGQDESEEMKPTETDDKLSQDQENSSNVNTSKDIDQNKDTTQEKQTILNPSSDKGESIETKVHVEPIDPENEQKTDPDADIEAKLEKLIDDTQPLIGKEPVSVDAKDLPTENSSQEVVEEECIKKCASSSPLFQASEQEDSEIESSTTKLDSTTTSLAYDEASDNELLDNPAPPRDPLEKATQALLESEAVVARMHHRRNSEQKASIEHVDHIPVFGDITCEPIKPMQELQKPSSPENDEDIILQDLQQDDTTRESSAQSESVIFGNSSSQLSESDDIFNENFDIKTLHRMNTVAVDHGTYKAPSMLLKSVTIDDTVKYIDPEKSTEESGDSFCLDDALTADVRKKMMAYSISEADSDYYEPGERTARQPDDFNISTALDKFTSSDTDTTIVSAATKIQAGARGFLTRRRLRRASMGTKTSLTDETKASFGDDAIRESLDELVEEEANKRLPKVHYQRQVGVNSLPAALGNTKEPEIAQSTPTQDELSTLTGTAELLASLSTNTQHEDAQYGHGISASSDYDVNGEGMDESSQALSSNLEATLAARRLTLQRGDAMRNDSAPDDDNGNGKQVDQAKITPANTGVILIAESCTLVESTTMTSATNTEKRTYSEAGMVTRMEKIKWFAMRQNSMPVQIDSEVFRVLPKHMRKRIKSAEGQQKKRIRLPRD